MELSFYGRRYTLRELRRLTGDLSQFAGVTPFEYTEGSARGMRAFEVRTGSGLRFAVELDRGMDLGACELRGIPIGWRTGIGPVHPAFYEPRGDEWLRTYEGGLMTLGGLVQMGNPCVDEGEEFGAHGRAALLSARECGYRVDWEAGTIRVWGTLREVKALRYDMELRREISCEIGTSRIAVRDVVTNLGTEPTPHMILYHMNVGYPLLGPGAEFHCLSAGVEGWDEESQRHVGGLGTVPGPVGVQYVFRHCLAGTSEWATAALVNRSLADGAYAAIRCRPKQLPLLWQWCSYRPQNFVLGMEPANSDSRGRGYARSIGELPILQGGEERKYELQLEFGQGETELAAFSADLAGT